MTLTGTQSLELKEQPAKKLDMILLLMRERNGAICGFWVTGAGYVPNDRVEGRGDED